MQPAHGVRYYQHRVKYWSISYRIIKLLNQDRIFTLVLISLAIFTMILRMRDRVSVKVNVESPFNYDDVFNCDEWEKKRTREKEGRENTGWRRKTEKGTELSDFGREQLGGKRTSRIQCRKPKGWARARKNMLKDKVEKKRVSRTQKPLYIFREALAPVDWSRPNSNGFTHYDNCILRIYKTKQKTWRQIGRTSATTIRRHPPTPCRKKKAKKVARRRLLRARKYRLAS